MKIWLLNHYAVPPQYYPLARPYLFAKNLIEMGHDVTIIAASTIHNSNSKNLIENGEKFKIINDNGVPYVLVNCTPYQGNGLKRVKNIWDFAHKIPKVLKGFEKPDVIVATSFDPLSCYAGIKFAKKNGIKSVAEIADLWPETLVAYKGISRKNLIVKYLRRIEKNIYKKSDAIIFTMEGAYDYILEQGWEKEISREKVYYINNGIDLEQFDFNKKEYPIEDENLVNDEIFKVVYAGSIRKVNNLDKLLDIAKKVSNRKVVFLVWGDGDELPRLKERIRNENINNVIFKGWVEKKNIPYITSNADLNFAHNEASPLFRFGISFNKIFDYLAAGKPILCDFKAKYNPVIQEKAGFSVDSGEVEEIAKVIDDISSYSKQRLDEMAVNARSGASNYDFRVLTEKLFEVINK